MRSVSFPYAVRTSNEYSYVQYFQGLLEGPLGRSLCFSAEFDSCCMTMHLPVLLPIFFLIPIGMRRHGRVMEHAHTSLIPEEWGLT